MALRPRGARLHRMRDDDNVYELELPESAEPRAEERARFPRRAVAAVLAVVAFHLMIVAWMELGFPPGRGLIVYGGLEKGAVLSQPWRLVTSLAVHSSFPHALWNGVSMLVFAVPLISTGKLLMPHWAMSMWCAPQSVIWPPEYSYHQRNV